MKDIRNDITESLKLVDKICRHEGIDYVLHGGTLLGAIREKGFIPWDDDADVCMPRESFERFASIVSKDNRCTMVYRGHVPRFSLISNPTVNVDVFIIDYLPKSTILVTFKMVLLKALQGMLKHNLDLKKLKKNRYYILTVTTHFVGRLLTVETLIKWYQRASQLFNKKKYKLFISNEMFRFLNVTFDMDFFDKTIDVEFEGIYLKSTTRWDEMLKVYYGEDYLIPKKENYFSR